MFILLLVFGFSHTLYGSPILPDRDSPQVSTSLSIYPRDVVAETGCHERTTYAIVWSCIVTIFACVWSAAHPNMPGPSDGGWTSLKPRAITTVYALIVPEFMAFWALHQHIAAGRIAEAFNSEFVNEQPPEQSLWDGVRAWLVSAPHILWTAVCAWFSDLPRDATRRGNVRAWTRTHGFFIQMGGFMLYENEYPLRVLTFEDMRHQIRCQNIDIPTVTEAEINDRSKGDSLSKGFVVLQTSWFVVQCLARLASGLPLSELEVITLGFAALNGIVYGVWWNKPQGIRVLIVIPVKPVLEERGPVSPQQSVLSTEPITAEGRRVDNNHGLDSTFSSTTKSQDPPARQPTARMQRRRADRITVAENMNKTAQAVIQGVSAHPALLPLKLFLHAVSFLLSLYRILGGVYVVPDGAKRVPMFYADPIKTLVPQAAACVIGTIFGAVHFFGWASVFPSATERLMWRVSVLIISSVPLMLLFTGLVIAYTAEGLLKDIFQVALCIVIIVGGVLYILARIALLTVALLSLRALPPQVFLQIRWTSFIAHI